MIVKAYRVKSQTLAQGLAVLCGLLIYNTSMAQSSGTISINGRLLDTACVLVEADSGAMAGTSAIIIPDIPAGDITAPSLGGYKGKYGRKDFLLKGCPIRPITITLSGTPARHQGTLTPSNEGQVGAASNISIVIDYATQNDNFSSISLNGSGKFDVSVTPVADGTAPFPLRVSFANAGYGGPVLPGKVEGILNYLVTYN